MRMISVGPASRHEYEKWLLRLLESIPFDARNAYIDGQPWSRIELLLPLEMSWDTVV